MFLGGGRGSDPGLRPETPSRPSGPTAAPTAVMLLVYDRLTLLNLQLSAEDVIKLDDGGRETLPPLLARVPDHLCRAPVPPSQRKRYRRHAPHVPRLCSGPGFHSWPGSLPLPVSCHISSCSINKAIKGPKNMYIKKKKKKTSWRRLSTAN